jgi:ammonia channel protein AmtB
LDWLSGFSIAWSSLSSSIWISCLDSALHAHLPVSSSSVIFKFFVFCHFSVSRALRRSGFFYGAPTLDFQQRPWFLSFTFAVACCVIVSGCLAERTRLLVYPAYTVAVSAIVHPLLVHWVWLNGSWLNSISSCKVLDFAGGLAVHVLGECSCCWECFVSLVH